MVTRLYKLDYVNGDFVSTLMGEYPDDLAAQAAQNEFRKTHRASWMIENIDAAARPDGSPLIIAAL